MRSAEPPTSSGRCGAKRSRAICEALRVAAAAPSPAISAIAASLALRQPAGNAPESRRSSSSASSGHAARYASIRPRHFASASSPRARASQPARTSSGTSKGGCFQPIASRAPATSSAPSGAPCVAAVPALVGAPHPMVVRQQRRLGRAGSARAAAMAAPTAPGS